MFAFTLSLSHTHHRGRVLSSPGVRCLNYNEILSEYNMRDKIGIKLFDKSLTFRTSTEDRKHKYMSEPLSIEPSSPNVTRKSSFETVFFPALIN